MLPKEAMFVDSARIKVRAGDGGNGCVSFRREKFVPRGGPDGGDGGNGGNVFIVAKDGYTTLYDCQERHYFNAQRGAHGSGKNKHGRNGRDLKVLVPPGTVVSDAVTGEQLADLVRPGQEFLAAKGGKGGKGNAAFKSATNRAPRQVEEGAPGERRHLALTLKVLADVALVGLPNAGKSTLISSITAARPKIADYAFTTREPNLGVVDTDHIFFFTVADIPGLVEDAHRGRGLGIKFLQHAQRAKALVLVIDVSEDAALPASEALDVLMREMELFDPSLPKRVAIVVGNKMDLVYSEEGLSELTHACESKGIKLELVSALTGQGLGQFQSTLTSLMATEGAFVDA